MRALHLHGGSGAARGIAAGAPPPRRGAVVAAALLGAATLVSPPALRGDTVAVINALRTGGCGEEAAVGTRVLPHSGLDAVARRLSRSDELEEALERAGYAAASSTSLHVRGPRNDREIRAVLVEGHCSAVNDPRYDEIGVFGSGDETWIVLGVRQPRKPPLEPFAARQRVLDLVNAARAEGRQCGRDTYAGTHALTLSRALTEAAAAHARDMAARGAASHRGSDGSRAGERIVRAGYGWRASGENVAAGQPDAKSVVAAWLESPGHCATLMAPYFTETGIAFATAPENDPEIYWTQVFAAPAR